MLAISDKVDIEQFYQYPIHIKRKAYNNIR